MKPEHETPDAHHASDLRPAAGRIVAGEYRRPMPASWWLRRRTYFLFMLRELTCLFVGGYAVFLLVLAALPKDQFAAVLEHPLTMVLHLPALLMVLYHAITWFQLAPQAIAVWRGEKRLSPVLIASAHYAAWIVVTLAVLAAVKTFAGG